MLIGFANLASDEDRYPILSDLGALLNTFTTNIITPVAVEWSRIEAAFPATSNKFSIIICVLYKINNNDPN